MDITIEHEDGHVVCRPHGELEAYNVDEVRKAFGGLIGDGSVLLDLSEVTFIDSAGLGCLIGMIRRVREAGGDVAVVSTRGSLTRLLRTTGFDRIVPVEETAVAARAALATRL